MGPAIEFTFANYLIIVLSRVVFKLVTQHGRGLYQEFMMVSHKGEGGVLRKNLVDSSLQDGFLKIIDIKYTLLDYFLKILDSVSDSGVCRIEETLGCLIN